MIAFRLERAGTGWDVAEIVGPDGRGGSVSFPRGVAWRTNAGVGAVVAAIALLRLRQLSDDPLVISSAGGAGESGLIRRCRGVLNSPRAGKHWTIPILAIEFDGTFIRTPLEHVMRVTGSGELILTPVPGVLGRFSFMVGAQPAEAGDLTSFVDDYLARVGGHTFVGQVEDNHDEASALRRTDRDNVHRRPCLAICGSAGHPDPPVELIAAVIDRLAAALSRHPWHVIHGPRGVGIDTVTIAVNRYQAMHLTSTLMVGPNVQIVAPACAVVFIGGSQRTTVEVRCALERHKTCIPVVSTGGAAAECWAQLQDHGLSGLTAHEVEHLGRASEPKAICDTIARVLTRLAPDARPTGGGRRGCSLCCRHVPDVARCLPGRLE